MPHRTNEDNKRDSIEEKEIHMSIKNNKEKITKKEMEYWLENNYTNWLPDVLREMINENKPNALINLKKEIKKATEDSKEANKIKEKSKEQLKEIIKKDYAKYTDKQVEELQKQIQSLKIDWDHNDMQQNYDDDDYELYSIERFGFIYPLDYEGSEIWDSKGRKVDFDDVSGWDREIIDKNYRKGGQIEE